jgi:hypothetical protein
MASTHNSIIINGSIGKELVFRQWAGKTIVSKAPGPRKRSASPAQVALQEKFVLASKYARSVVQGPDEGIREAYSEKLRPRQNLYSRALEDFMSSPTVDFINTTKYTGQAGSTIAIRAVDDFRVTGVEVSIYAADGLLLEKGSAIVQINGIDWTYTATQPNNKLPGTKIKVVATDVPGNEGVLEITLLSEL